MHISLNTNKKSVLLIEKKTGSPVNMPTKIRVKMPNENKAKVTFGYKEH